MTGLVGHSKGGTGVILYAAAYDDIPRVVNVAGRFDNMRGKHHCANIAGPGPIHLPELYAVVPLTLHCWAPLQCEHAPAFEEY